MMMLIDKDAAQYIREHTGAVVIDMRLEPAVGGCVCSPKHITGSYVPALSLGKPSMDERSRYRLEVVENVEVYSQDKVAAKEGCTEIRIRLRGSFGFRWLELEGAKAIVCYNS